MRRTSNYHPGSITEMRKSVLTAGTRQKKDADNRAFIQYLLQVSPMGEI